MLAGHGSITVGPGADAVWVMVPDVNDTATGLVVRVGWPGAPVIMPFGAANRLSCTSPVGKPDGPNVSTCGLARPIVDGEILVHVPTTQAVVPAATSYTKPVGKVMAIVDVAVAVPKPYCAVIGRRSPSAYWGRFNWPMGRSSQGKSCGVMISARQLPSVTEVVHSGADSTTPSPS